MTSASEDRGPYVLDEVLRFPVRGGVIDLPSARLSFESAGDVTALSKRYWLSGDT